MTAAMEVLPSTLIFVLPTSLFLFMKGTVDVGTLIMCVLLSYASYKPLIKAMSHLDTMANVKVVIEEIKDVMKLPELERGNTSQEISSYDVTFDNVTFGYDENKKVFQDLSFTAKEGELTAIVGYSGGGTILQEGGSNLSGGERQRITIARALLKDSPIVLLDEATAYSDPDNEAEIQKSLDALVKDKTVIMIAHRLSTIIHANKIIVVNSGKIEAEGTHQELLQSSNTYSKMWKAHNSVYLNGEVI